MVYDVVDMLIRFSYDRVNVLLNSYHSHHYPCSCLLAIHLSCWRAAPTSNSTYPTVFFVHLRFHDMLCKQNGVSSWRGFGGSQIDMAAGWVIYSQIAKLQHDLQSLLVPHPHKKWASNSQELSNPLSLVPVWSANLWNSEGNGFSLNDRLIRTHRAGAITRAHTRNSTGGDRSVHTRRFLEVKRQEHSFHVITSSSSSWGKDGFSWHENQGNITVGPYRGKLFR